MLRVDARDVYLLQPQRQLGLLRQVPGQLDAI
jgi:hypothetical protein